MPSFSCAQNTVVHNSEFVDIGVQNIICGSSGIDILRDASIPEAAYDAEARHLSPSCFPGTREQYIEDITHWALTPVSEQSTPLYWMRGPAGVGKTAIAQTCVERLKDSGHFGAAFFFSTNGCSDHRRFFTTIAYQLSVELRDYRDIVNQRVYRDKTLVTKTMSSQFKALIVEPLRQLQMEGKEVEQRVIFVDGLDECWGQDVQSKIIEIVAASVRNHVMPFRWAFFSRPEPHIEASFARPEIDPFCLATFLPVSRDIDGEIEAYLRGGFENILRCRDLLPTLVPWPADEDIQKLVDASAGLFIFAAAVLRFIDHSPSLEPQEPLLVVLASISLCHNSHSDHSQHPFAELDALYMLIMQRIPDKILPSAQLLLTIMLLDGYESSWSAIYLSNIACLSEVEFRGIYNQFRGVLRFSVSPRSHYPVGPIDSARSFENASTESVIRLQEIARKAGGLVSFYHKSFYDFLRDRTRSGSFCIDASTRHEKLFDHFLRLHQDYARSYVIHGQDLLLAPDVPDSAASLSWPYSNEFVNSYLKAQVFYQATEFLKYRLKFNPKIYHQRSGEISKLDYRKSLINASKIFSIGLLPCRLLGCSAFGMNIHGNFFGYIPSNEFQDFDARTFSQMIDECKRLKIIRPYHPSLSSRLKSLVLGKCQGPSRSGLYIRGRGNKAVYWCWKLDPESRFYREIETGSLRDAKRAYMEKVDL